MRDEGVPPGFMLAVYLLHHRFMVGMIFQELIDPLFEVLGSSSHLAFIIETEPFGLPGPPGLPSANVPSGFRFSPFDFGSSSIAK
jgi:hypothetical protein